MFTRFMNSLKSQSKLGGAFESVNAKNLSRFVLRGTGTLFTSIVAYQSYKYYRPNNISTFLDKEMTVFKIAKSDSSKKWTPRKPNTDLDSVGGNEEVLNSLADIVCYLQDPEKFIKSGAKPPRGIILSGPPGVGKTMMAEAVAGHSGVPIIIISGPEIESKYVGESEKKLRELFEAARQAAPCVLCIDEIDSIASKRFSSSDRTGFEHSVNSIVDQFLSLLTQDNTGVVIFATTNNHDILDPALVRPGRFDRHVYIGLPDLKNRMRILEIHTKNKKLDSVSLDDLANLSATFSGAKLAAWVNEAVMCASRDGVKAITKSHFDQARSILENGVIGQHINNPIQKKRTAMHEIGHALVGHVLGLTLYKVSLLRSGKSFGYTEFLPEDDQLNRTKEEVLNEICVALAGRAADEVFSVLRCGCKADLDHAKTLAYYLADQGLGSSLSGIARDQDIELILIEQMNRAKKILQENPKKHALLVNFLMEKEELRHEDLVEILAGKNIISSTSLISSFFNINLGKSSKPKISFLPPKKEYQGLESPESSGNKTIKKFPFTLGEVARAFDITESVIRELKLDCGRGCRIVFKPSFAKHDHMNNVSNILKKNDVEHIYLRNHLAGCAELIVYDNGLSDFSKFIKSKNQPDAQSSDENVYEYF